MVVMVLALTPSIDARIRTGAAFHDSSGELRDETSGELRDETSGEVRDETSGELRDEASGEVRDETSGEVRDETSGEVQDEASGEMKDEEYSIQHDNDPFRNLKVTPVDLGGAAVTRQQKRKGRDVRPLKVQSTDTAHHDPVTDVEQEADQSLQCLLRRHRESPAGIYPMLKEGGVWVLLGDGKTKIFHVNLLKHYELRDEIVAVSVIPLEDVCEEQQLLRLPEVESWSSVWVLLGTWAGYIQEGENCDVISPPAYHVLRPVTGIR
ncbi:hypothetical protein Pmani_027323 [Petrolisthes manimaculis]|uniref:Uncharacterized protein n=1 Tax=Petrolisthes manimaculis TaxID=1843537 RepID=A0AAE1P490_9EUCA|nr:hypothetical protein Pmani_027323 [Petrolisthes manimaculis]